MEKKQNSEVYSYDLMAIFLQIKITSTLNMMNESHNTDFKCAFNFSKTTNHTFLKVFKCYVMEGDTQ